MTDEVRAGEPHLRIIGCPHCGEQLSIEAAAAPPLDVDRLTNLRGTLALIADGRGPAIEMARAALDVDTRLSEKAP